MVTLSPFPGTEAPGAPPELTDHVEVDDQGPDATENLLAEKILCGSSNEKRKRQKTETLMPV